jgi:hypothetical protein
MPSAKNFCYTASIRKDVLFSLEEKGTFMTDFFPKARLSRRRFLTNSALTMGYTRWSQFVLGRLRYLLSFFRS